MQAEPKGPLAPFPREQFRLQTGPDVESLACGTIRRRFDGGPGPGV